MKMGFQWQFVGFKRALCSDSIARFLGEKLNLFFQQVVTKTSLGLHAI